ncbi:hypothetical protein A2U01_0052381, partial [Trifolium medium]|nr:hypothetical protein [Trifolium medium]
TLFPSCLSIIITISYIVISPEEPFRSARSEHYPT